MLKLITSKNLDNIYELRTHLEEKESKWVTFINDEVEAPSKNNTWNIIRAPKCVNWLD